MTVILFTFWFIWLRWVSVAAWGLCSCGAHCWLPHSMWDVSSPARDQTCVPCLAKWILNHWTTREVPRHFINSHNSLDFLSSACGFCCSTWCQWRQQSSGAPGHIHTAPWHLGGEGGKARLIWGALSTKSLDISGPLFPMWQLHMISLAGLVPGNLAAQGDHRAQAAFLRHRLGTDCITSVTLSWLKWVTEVRPGSLWGGFLQGRGYRGHGSWRLLYSLVAPA